MDFPIHYVTHLNKKVRYMLKIGKINRLEVIESLPFGFYLGDSDYEKVLLPTRNAPENCQLGDTLDVFVHHDSDDRIIATTQTPLAEVNQIAFLRVKSITSVGAFLDWGLDKDLLVPFSEQEKPLSEGVSYVVYVFQDPHTNRLAASTKLRRFLNENGEDLIPALKSTRNKVDLLICGRTELGYKAVVNQAYLGLLFKNEVFKPIRIGDRLEGYVKRVREDGKIDLSLQQHNNSARSELTERIIDDLQAHGGFSTLTDKSSAEEIELRFGVSKNAYKKALGALYKDKRILLDKQKVTLTGEHKSES